MSCVSYDFRPRKGPLRKHIQTTTVCLTLLRLLLFDYIHVNLIPSDTAGECII